MTIARVEFIGFVVAGPRQSARQSYKPSDWKDWTAAIEGPSVVLEGEKRRIEVPRSRCIVTFDLAAAGPAMAQQKAVANASGGKR